MSYKIVTEANPDIKPLSTHKKYATALEKAMELSRENQGQVYHIYMKEQAITEAGRKLFPDGFWRWITSIMS